jgi:hypothetical protein
LGVSLQTIYKYIKSLKIWESMNISTIAIKF